MAGKELMKYQSIQNIFLDPDLTPAAKIVAVFLCHRSTASGCCYPAVQTIADACSLSKRTIQRQLKELEDKGYLVIKERFLFGEQLTNRYYFTIPEKRFQTSNASLKEIILEDPDFLSWMDQEEIDTKNPGYKAQMMTDIFHCQSLSSREKLAALYLTFHADREAMAYFDFFKMAEELSLSSKRLNAILHCLERRNILHSMKKHHRGQMIYLVMLKEIKTTLNPFYRPYYLFYLYHRRRLGQEDQSVLNELKTTIKQTKQDHGSQHLWSFVLIKIRKIRSADRRARAP